VDHQTAVNRQLTERYILGELDIAEAAAFEEHFFECPLCAEDILLASQLVANLRAVLGEDNPVQTIEIKRNARFLDLTIQRKTTGSASDIDCEFQFPGVAVPIVVPASTAEGPIHLHLPVHRLPVGPCTVILRDKNSRAELERYQIVVSRA
jgi:putative zinc finger protein